MSQEEREAAIVQTAAGKQNKALFSRGKDCVFPGSFLLGQSEGRHAAQVLRWHMEQRIGFPVLQGFETGVRENAMHEFRAVEGDVEQRFAAHGAIAASWHMVYVHDVPWLQSLGKTFQKIRVY